MTDPEHRRGPEGESIERDSVHEEDRAVPSPARAMGFADHSALVHLLRRAFGVTTGPIRNTLGWEWLSDRWLQLSGRAG